jgi:DEAD/DEAH box helicase domain-containing protein
LSHSSQKGRSDGIHDTAAVLDTIPYSRVFYHAHPGAIITHRGKKYEIVAMTPPPEFVKENFGCMRSQQLAAYVRPTNASYLTRPLADTIVTIVKQFENVEICEGINDEEIKSRNNNTATFAGCGAVSVKRQVRGYKKLSLVNFSEIARTELTLPPIEFDTFGLYICTDSNSLAESLGERYGPGVHALSHALLAVAPLFVMGLSRGDIECCHDFYSPNKIVLFDERAGGSGCVQRLWQSFFQPNGILESAVDLLRNCSSCTSDSRYDGGCPACLHASQCSKFNTHLSRSAAIVVGERMIGRIKETSMYNSGNSQIFDGSHDSDSVSRKKPSLDSTPRRKAREQAMKKAKEMHSSRDRQYVISRPSWPLDGQSKHLEHG